MSTDTIERTPESPTRRITRRRELPHRRAVVGGFLIAVAAVGVFAAYRRAEAPPTTRYIAATRAVGIGERLTASDLGEVALDLPPAQAVSVYTDPDALIGAITTSALLTDQLLAIGDVREAQGYTAAEEVSFPVTASHALGASLQAGERVDVIAAYGGGGDAYTLTIVTDAMVISASQPDGFGAADVVEVRLGVSGEPDALAVAHAVTQGEVFLVRSPDADASGRIYRPAQNRDTDTQSLSDPDSAGDTDPDAETTN